MKSTPSGNIKKVNDEFDAVVVKAFARATFNINFMAAHPEATKEMRSARWTDERVSNIKGARVVMRALKKQGITISAKDLGA